MLHIKVDATTSIYTTSRTSPFPIRNGVGGSVEGTNKCPGLSLNVDLVLDDRDPVVNMQFSLQYLTSSASVLSLLLLQGMQQGDGHCTLIIATSNPTQAYSFLDGFPVVLINGVVSEWWQYVR